MSFDDSLVGWLQLALCIAGAALLAWGWLLERRGHGDWLRRLRDGLLIALGLLGAAAYFNFGAFHEGRFLHVWDTYHYYVGSKYFPELGYERLYHCTLVAASEDDPESIGEVRYVTDLRTNQRMRSSTLTADPQGCKKHFTPQRWEDFRRDMEVFRELRYPARWDRIFRDHGYNASPVWNALGQTLANTGPASKSQVLALALLDPAFLLAMLAMVAWAFGWRVALVAAIFLGTDIPGRFLWTGGSFLRHDWLFWLVGSLCLLKKDYPFIAGAFIAYATLLRLFPGLAVAGPALALVAIYLRDKRIDRGLLRYFAGGIAATVVLVGVSLLVSGPGSWRDFARNSEKHMATPLTNNMGLPLVLAWRPDTTVARYAEAQRGQGLEAWRNERHLEAWRKSRIETIQAMRPAFIAACVAFVALLYFAIARSGAEPWIAASLGVGMIVLADITCYYYCFYVGVLLAMRRHLGVGIAVLLMNAGWLLMNRYSTSEWADEKYVAMSALAVAVYAVILLGFAATRPRATPAT